MKNCWKFCSDNETSGKKTFGKRVGSQNQKSKSKLIRSQPKFVQVGSDKKREIKKLALRQSFFSKPRFFFKNKLFLFILVLIYFIL